MASITASTSPTEKAFSHPAMARVALQMQKEREHPLPASYPTDIASVASAAMRTLSLEATRRTTSLLGRAIAVSASASSGE